MRFLTWIGFYYVCLTSFTVCYFFLQKRIDLSAVTVLFLFTEYSAGLVSWDFLLLSFGETFIQEKKLVQICTVAEANQIWILWGRFLKASYLR